MAKNEVTGFKVVVIGGSAGSLEIILQIIEQLPPEPGAVFIIVVHRRNDKVSHLESVFSNKSKLDVKEVEDKDSISPNTIYIAPPDYHLLVENEQSFSLDDSEKIHLSRPSIDVCFESVAETFKNRCIGVLLSGANADGAAGMAYIKKMGGYTIVQNPTTADVGFMPQQAINLGAADEIIDAEKLPGKIMELLNRL